MKGRTGSRKLSPVTNGILLGRHLLVAFLILLNVSVTSPSLVVLLRKGVKDIKGRILTGIALILSFSFMLSLWALTIQYIGVDNANKATIISGLLSMIGGMIGAFSAYLIARAQITKQLDLQDQKDRGRILLGIRLSKAEETLDVITRTRMSFFSLHGAWTTLLGDYKYYITSHLTENIDYEELKNEGLLDILSEFRDKFITTYSECYKYKPYFPELITNIARDHEELFKNLTLDINEVMYQFLGVKNVVYGTNADLWKSIKEKVERVDLNFNETMIIIDKQIIDAENEIQKLILNFNN